MIATEDAALAVVVMQFGAKDALGSAPEPVELTCVFLSQNSSAEQKSDDQSCKPQLI
jgi:hypothetical protein